MTYRKYRNEPVVVDGFRFASKREAARYHELKLLERAGEIYDLKLQPSYDLSVNGKKVCRYVGDFSYLTQTGMPVCEDVKSDFTAKNPTFRLKAKLFHALFGTEIEVVK